MTLELSTFSHSTFPITTMPPVHKNTTGIWRLLHKPDEKLSLKDIFDNLKNFAVCGGLYIFAQRVAETGGNLESSAAYFLEAIAIILGVLCFLQAWVLAQKGFYELSPLDASDFDRTPILARLKLLALLALPVALAISVSVAAYSYAHGIKP